MSQAKELEQKYQDDLKSLQETCTHVKTTWALVSWGPGRYGNTDHEICDNCWKTVNERIPSVLRREMDERAEEMRRKYPLQYIRSDS